KRLAALVNSYDAGRLLREGISTAIVGSPNVGKSTLMNLLAGYERSIVTDIAGTTRDVIEDRVRLGDLLLNLSDTAGIHNT
ncbi:MAG: GTPase, partial [Angelakisella sp.]